MYIRPSYRIRLSFAIAIRMNIAWFCNAGFCCVVLYTVHPGSENTGAKVLLHYVHFRWNCDVFPLTELRKLSLLSPTITSDSRQVDTN